MNKYDLSIDGTSRQNVASGGMVLTVGTTAAVIQTQPNCVTKKAVYANVCLVLLVRIALTVSTFA